jgi:hypothetical protein
MSLDRPKLAFSDILEKARPAERTIRLCLRGDLVAEWEMLERDLARAQATQVGDSLAGTGAAPIAAAMRALREQMDDATVTFTVRAKTRPEYRAFCAAHPPRKGPDGKVLPEDEEGLDTSTFGFDLVRACVVEPEMTDEQYARLVDTILSDRQFEQLYLAALAVCRGDVDVPFSSAVSMLMSSSGDGSSAPNGSASASAASTAGSLASPSNGTTPAG